MDDIQEQQDIANEISEAISNPVGFGADVDEDELLAELDELEQASYMVGIFYQSTVLLWKMYKSTVHILLGSKLRGNLFISFFGFICRRSWTST